MFSSAGAQPISLKSFRGLGHFPNKIARVYKQEHCLPSAFRSWQVMRSGYRRALLAGMASSGVGTHRICLLFCKEIPVVPRRSLPFWQAMHSGTHSCVLHNFSLADLLQNLVGKHPKPFNDF